MFGENEPGAVIRYTYKLQGSSLCSELPGDDYSCWGALLQS